MSNETGKKEEKRENENVREVVSEEGCCTIRVEVICCRPSDENSCC